MARPAGEMESMMVELLKFVTPEELLDIKNRPVDAQHIFYREIIERFLAKRDAEDRHRRISDMVGQDIWVHLPCDYGTLPVEGRMIGLNEVDGLIEATVLYRGEKVTFDPHMYQPHLRS